MGAGKSSVGTLVAAKTHRSFVDVDIAIAIVERTGKTVRQLWQERGESAYRDLESEVVLDSLSGDVVLAVPGGVVLDPAVRVALAGAFVVWLRTNPATLASRVQHDDHRPLLGEHHQVVLTTMAQERAKLYEQVADAVVDTDESDAETVAGLKPQRRAMLRPQDNAARETKRLERLVRRTRGFSCGRAGTRGRTPRLGRPAWETNHRHRVRG
jgi:shikimate kinase